MNLTWIKKAWEILNKIHPETRTMIIIFLFGYILYSQITRETERQMYQKEYQTAQDSKEAELYSMNTAVEINRQVLLIADKDLEAFDVLLLNYHNNTLSLLGYKYLYLSCLTEAPRSLDVLPLKLLWNRIDYVYYADELAKIHGQSFILFENVEQMAPNLPKLYRLVKASDTKAISFFTIEGHDSPIGLVVLFYKDYKKYDVRYAQGILPCIQRLALLLDYNNNKK